MSVLDRFLRYVRYDTQSDERSAAYPSTEGQLVLLRDLASELRQLGVADAEVDAHGYVMATVAFTHIAPARAAGLEPTVSMAGGSNNYLPGAPVVDRIGKGGFWMTGTVRRAGDGAPLAGQRIQIWAHTTEGYENDFRSHGATLTDANGVFRLEMPQIIPAFGQPHGHLVYDSGAFKTVFLLP